MLEPVGWGGTSLVATSLGMSSTLSVSGTSSSGRKQIEVGEVDGGNRGKVALQLEAGLLGVGIGGTVRGALGRDVGVAVLGHVEISPDLPAGEGGLGVLVGDRGVFIGSAGGIGKGLYQDEAAGVRGQHRSRGGHGEEEEDRQDRNDASRFFECA